MGKLDGAECKDDDRKTLKMPDGYFEHFCAVTCGECVPPTKAPVPSKSTTSKTKFPTLAPTPKLTNPKKPAFVKAAHEKKKKAFKVVAKIADATRSPTRQPTKGPTNKGYKIVKRKQKRKAAKAQLAFPITVDQAKNPVMQAALTTGVAKSLGKDPADVKITSIDGVAVSNSAVANTKSETVKIKFRRLADVKIEFEVLSNSDDATEAAQLKADLETAATEGSIVANVQEAAN